jgi:hypothetical protein
MNRRTSILLTVAMATAVTNVAIAADTKMVVPSSTTAVALDAMSRKANVIADVLTVDRKEYLLHLDGSGGGAFSGQRLSPDSVNGEAAASTLSIPLDQIALGYFREIPARAKNQSVEGNYPNKNSYPSIAKVGAAEGKLDCGGLDLEIARAGTIRWYARQQGAVPFTAHEALAQHEKNAAIDVGVGLLVAVALVGAAGGGGPNLFAGGGGGSHDDGVIGSETFRWAVTAADRRELGLMQLKDKQSCSAVKLPDGATSDMEILAKIEATREALGAHQISDVEQRDQQARLLDQLDPAHSATEPVPQATEFAAATTAANEKKGEPLGGASRASYKRYVLIEAKSPGCAYPKFGWPLSGHPTQMGGPLDVRERALTWTRADSEAAESLQFKDILELGPPEHHYNFWFIPIRKTDGSCLFLNVTSDSSYVADMRREAEESVRATVLAAMTESAK